jgi:hypothetical protein
MQKTEFGFLTMNQTLLAHFDNHVNLWERIVPLANTVNEVRTHVTALAQESQKQGNSTTGHTQNKENQKELMCALAQSLVLKIRPFAKISENNILLAAVDFSESELSRGAEQEIINRCQTIHDQGQVFLTPLAEFLVTPDSLQAFQTAIQLFRPMTPQRDALGDSKTTATANIKLCIKNIREKLELLDDMVPGMITDTNFVATYRQGRQFSLKGVRKAKPPVVKAPV